MEIRNGSKKVKVTFRPAPAALKILLCLLILLSMGALLALRWVHNGIRSETQELTDEAAAVEYANQDLQDKIDHIDSVENIQEIARDELDLVDPDTIVIDPN